jgi:PilZ domain
VSQASVPQSGMVKPASRGNRRAIIRYRCAPATVGKVFSADDQEFQRAWVLDLSLKGIGMELARPLEQGHIVIITIRGNDGGKLHELSALVIHCNAVSQGDWYVGCEFAVPLSPEELEQLL